jgi:cell cycle sensor histidine kinase DivJ
LATALASALAAIGFAAAGGRAPSLMQAALFVAPATLYAAAIVWAQREAQAADARVACADHGRYQDLADALGDLVLGCDRSGSVTFACAQEAQAFGLAQRDLAGRGFFERLHIQDRPAYLAAVAQAASGDRTVITLVRLRAGATAADGAAFDAPSYSHVELRCKAARSSDGADVIVVARDVSAARALEGELATLRAQAEGASVWKDRFLANVSHELRTPLNAVIGFSDIMRDPATAIEPARRVEYSGIVHDAGQHLLAMVNSLLDVSKIEAGRFELQAEPVQITTVIDQVMEMMRLRAEQGGVALRATIDPRAGEIVADKRACRQILTNLVANAVKFTGDGGSVGVFARPEGNSVALEVVDTGCGIAGADLARLGDAFFQASSAYNRSHDGTGLGLSLVRGLVGLHGGSIAIESAPGEGTRVVVRLPLDCRAAAPGASPARIETTARRVVGFEPGQRPGAAAALELFRKAG